MSRGTCNNSISVQELQVHCHDPEIVLIARNPYSGNRNKSLTATQAFNQTGKCFGPSRIWPSILAARHPSMPCCAPKSLSGQIRTW